MTEQEMRELDGWIADELGIKPPFKTNGLWGFAHVPPYTVNSFSDVKREIERRGWIWQAAYCLEGGYDFAIFDPDGSVVHSLDGEETEVARILAVEHAEIEELAGCLAFKAAVEATDEVCQCIQGYCCDRCWRQAYESDPCPTPGCMNPAGHTGSHGVFRNTNIIAVSRDEILEAIKECEGNDEK